MQKGSMVKFLKREGRDCLWKTGIFPVMESQYAVFEITIPLTRIYRIQSAIETLGAATLCMESKHYKGAINRSYYAALYAVKAVLALEETDFKRYKDAAAYFNQVKQVPCGVARSNKQWVGTCLY